LTPAWRRILRTAQHIGFTLRGRLHGGEPRRYRHLLDTIDRYRCRRILEIGTWNGHHAEQMIRAAMRYSAPHEVEYYGFDMFEEIDEAKIAAEISKQPPPQHEVEARLQGTGASVQLFKGDTVATLPRAVPTLPAMDLIFIDGGHSYETLSNDWEHCRRLMHADTVVLFDDFWGEEDAGTDRVVRAIDRRKYQVTVLDPEDAFVKEWGVLRVRFVRVQRRAVSGSDAQ
jgi:predicted O-methyltransferase YrrM